jgi:ATP-dependent DNA helicase RecG
LREGDHAEFTLLERKNRASKLDGSTLFATLEPCAPGARNHPKLSCAERIVNARIKEVWVGITDPDPTVDRKGIQFLQDHGVTVHMFDHDLQEEIQAANKEFIAQALVRKAAVEEPEEDTALSTLEHPVTAADLRDFSKVVLGRYRSLGKIEDPVDSEGFKRRLAQQGLLKADGAAFVPSGFGMLLFGQSPREGMPQAGLLGTVHWPDGSEEVRDFDGPMLLIPEQAIQ